MTERRDDARERLIEGTRELLWDRGYVGTSPAAIWRASGVGQGSMYHHFPGKPELALAAEQRAAEAMRQQIREAFAREGSAYERISAYLLRERDTLRGCPIGRLVADPEIAADERLREPVRETFAVLHACLVSALEEGKATGEFTAGLNADQTASALSAVIQGGYTLARAEASPGPFDSAIAGALALLRATMPGTRLRAVLARLACLPPHPPPRFISHTAVSRRHSCHFRLPGRPRPGNCRMPAPGTGP